MFDYIRLGNKKSGQTSSASKGLPQPMSSNKVSPQALSLFLKTFSNCGSLSKQEFYMFRFRVPIGTIYSYSI